MAKIYTCDVCKKKTQHPGMIATNSSSPFKYLCESCWESVVKFLEKRAEKKTAKDA